ncbi:MAG TPA: MvaI/BcnI family restriction endonuclease [Hanamia sp.]
MKSKIPQSSKTAFKVIREIIEMGSVDIPPNFKGAGAPGNTLEFLLNVKENNLDSPDLLDWEIKFHGGNALLTLFHKDPQPKGIMNKLVDAFGWENAKGQISFRHTISGKSERGFFIDNKNNKITVSNINNLSIEPYWDNNIILNAIAAKLRRLILVHGIVDKEKKQVIYNSAMAYWNLDMINICEAIKEGKIYIDFDARTTGVRGTSLRNHGTKFRIKVNDIDSIYENSQLIV